MKNKSGLISIFCILIALFLSLFFYNKNEQTKLLTEIRSYKNLQSKYEFVKYNLYLTYDLKCTFLDKKLILKNRKDEKIILGDILLDSITYILSIPPMFCSSCNERVLNELPDIIEEQGAKLKILCSPADVNSVINYCQHKISDKNLLITKVPLIDISEKLNHIYILGITSSGQIKSIFLINDSNMNLFKEYLNNYL